MAHDPGYIKGYVPGVRENGGQYTHAALWIVLAYLMRGDGDEAAALLDLINPISHALDRRGVRALQGRALRGRGRRLRGRARTSGRGGWTWYTGSASWFYRVAVEFAARAVRVAYRDGARRLSSTRASRSGGTGFEMRSAIGLVALPHPRREPARCQPGRRPRRPRRAASSSTRASRSSTTAATHEVVVTLLGG